MNRQEAIHYLTHDQETGKYTGDLSVPCSRWGHNSADCAGVAYDLDVILAAETGRGMDTKTLDHAMELVVNDHDDVAYTFTQDPRTRDKYSDELAEWGNPDAYNETGDPHAYEARYLAEAQYLGADTAMAAATWELMSEEDARTILEDVDPKVMDRYPEPNLSREGDSVAGSPTPDDIAFDVTQLSFRFDRDKYVDDIVDAWEDGRDRVWGKALVAHALRVLGQIDDAMITERELETQMNELGRAARS